MPEALETFIQSRPPTAEKPLLGRTILAVEDSRYVSGVLRLMCQRSGARLRRADTLRAAARHLRTYRPNIVIVDLGLPDGSGLDLLRDLHSAEPRIDGLIALSGDDTLATAAKSAGADMFMPKPLPSVARFQADILSLLPADAHPVGPRAVTADLTETDDLALQEDFQHVAEMLAGPDRSQLSDYGIGFLMGLAKASGDTVLGEAVTALQNAQMQGCALTGPIAKLAALVDRRMEQFETPV